MKSPALRILTAIFTLLPALFVTGCAGMFPPPPPLWDSSLYDTVAVLPVRMTVETGRQPFTSEDTELSGQMGGKMQAALSIVIRYKNYDVLSPDDLSERLMKEDDLADAFVSLAASQGVMGRDRSASPAEGMEGAAVIGEALGADLLVVAYGNGEYHSVGENLFQGIITGLLSDGKEQYQAPPSFLEITVNFIDPVTGTRIARLSERRIDYEDKVIPLSRLLDRALRRIPKKLDPVAESQEPGEMPKP